MTGERNAAGQIVADELKNRAGSPEGGAAHGEDDEPAVPEINKEATPHLGASGDPAEGKRKAAETSAG